MTGQKFGHVHRMPDGRYRAGYQHPTPSGPRHTAPGTFASIREARQWLHQEAERITAGTWTPPATRTHPGAGTGHPSPPNFAVFATGYLRDRRDLRQSTRASYLAVLHNHLIPAFGTLTLDGIDQAAVRTWWASYGRRNPAARTAAYALLKHIMAAATAAGLAPASNPCTLTPTAGDTRARPAHHPDNTSPTRDTPPALADHDPTPRRRGARQRADDHHGRAGDRCCWRCYPGGRAGYTTTRPGI